ncbi:histone-lysine N-methyltransferase SETD1B-like isoform X2 [Mya arenaria]|uniref:histone-lysine N-methyltransferase SETD1B-like isoform X2 n=1 Tax=Mya arenaria TaxID=6604 RepID=UPI0022E27CFC|nr:histone-lysine N-methyltransferase SETD1B-like isoform X2 [Mya arenaria]
MNHLGDTRVSDASIENNEAQPEILNDLDLEAPKTGGAGCNDAPALNLSSLRTTMEAVRREMEVSYSSDGPPGLNIPVDKPTEQTLVKQPYSVDGEQIYSKYVQIGDNNVMLICEPRERTEKTVCRQEGSRNIMINMRVSTNFYQLIGHVRQTKETKVIPLDSEGEVWLEIKRKSKLGSGWRQSGTHNEARRSAVSNSTVSSQGSVMSWVDNSRYPVSEEPQPRHAQEHEDDRVGAGCSNRLEDLAVAGATGRRSPVENTDYVEAQECPYHVLSIDQSEDRLSIHFTRRRGDDMEDLERMIMGHQSVRDFLNSPNNDFEARIDDWEYQRDQSLYSYITGRPLLADEVEEVQVDEDVTVNGRPLPVLIPPVPPRGDRMSTGSSGSMDSGSSGGSVTVSLGHPTWTIEEREGPYRSWPELDPPSAMSSTEKKQPCSPPIRETPPLPPRRYYSEPGSPQPASATDRLPPPSPHLQFQAQTSQTDSGCPATNSQRTLTNASSGPKPSVEIMGNPALSPPPRPPGSTSDRGSDTLISCNWYHGPITKDEAKKRLDNQKPGSFLVRDAARSNEQDGDSCHCYTLEFVDDNYSPKKLMIMKTKGEYHFKEFRHKTFQHVEQLVQRVINSGLEIKDGSSLSWKTITVRPVARTNPPP